MEKNIASIYRITNNINGKCYIGFDSSYPKRIKQHLNNSSRGENSPLYDEIRQYGWENFSKELLYQSTDREHCLNVMENFFIIENNSFLDGYNRTLGGDGSLNSPRPWSESQRKKHSDCMKGNKNPRSGYKYSAEEKIKLSNRMKDYWIKNPDKKLVGEKNPMYGKTHSEEWKNNHSEILKNKYASGEIKKIENVTCNFCDLSTIPGNLKRHQRVCEKNPNKQGIKKRSLLF